MRETAWAIVASHGATSSGAAAVAPGSVADNLQMSPQGAGPLGLTNVTALSIRSLGGGLLRFDVSGGIPDTPYDLYYVDSLLAQRWQWRRVYTGAQTDTNGNAMFLLQQPDPNQGFFVILSAADYDVDFLTDGYEAWFTYGGGPLTSMTDKDTDGDFMPDSWEVEYGLDPTDNGSINLNNGASGNPDGDAYPNSQESANYNAFDGSYDPLKAYCTPSSRPVVFISSSDPFPICDQSSFTISRFAGCDADYSSPLTVYYSVGGSLSYERGDYTLSPAPTEWPRIYSAVISNNEQSVTVIADAHGVSANPGDVNTFLVSLTPYAVSPVTQVSDPTQWKYVVDWGLNRATNTYDHDHMRPFANCQDVMTGTNAPVTIVLSGGDACNGTLAFAIVTNSGPCCGTLGPITRIDDTHASVTYTPSPSLFSSCAGTNPCIDGFDFTVSNPRQSDPAHVIINVVAAPVLSTACEKDRILLQWTVPLWLEQTYGQTFFNDFKIYRCTSASGPCAPADLYVTVGNGTVGNPEGVRLFVDTDVQPNQTYCYRITFEHVDGCDPATVWESPFSNTNCSQLCSVPPKGPLDIAFIVDNTGSMGLDPLAQLNSGIANVLDDIETGSGGNYRLALLTPDENQVDVRLPFSQNNRNAFTTALAGVPQAGGNNPPESTDECLNTVLNALTASGRVNPRNCTPASTPLQIDDFTPGFRTNATKLVVMITDAEAGGFCDDGDTGTRAHLYALQAQTNCVKINAIQVRTTSGLDMATQAIMVDYYHTTCGWYSDVPHDGTGIADAVDRMLYAAGYCSCP
jgi:hypothetical protein